MIRDTVRSLTTWPEFHLQICVLKCAFCEAKVPKNTRGKQRELQLNWMFLLQSSFFEAGEFKESVKP